MEVLGTLMESVGGTEGAIWVFLIVPVNSVVAEGFENTMEWKKN